MTEREMGMILTTLGAHKEQLDRIEAHAAANRTEQVADLNELVGRVSKLEAWRYRSAGATALAVVAGPILAAALMG